MYEMCTTHNNVALTKRGCYKSTPLQESRPEIPEEEERRNIGFDYLLEPYGSLLEEVER